jgi:hypothetical protein
VTEAAQKQKHRESSYELTHAESPPCAVAVIPAGEEKGKSEKGVTLGFVIDGWRYETTSKSRQFP